MGKRKGKHKIVNRVIPHGCEGCLYLCFSTGVGCLLWGNCISPCRYEGFEAKVRLKMECFKMYKDLEERYNEL